MLLDKIQGRIIVLIIYIGNLFSLFGAVFLIISSFSKNKEGMVKWQILDCSANIVGVFLLGGYSGVIVTAVALIRNILICKNKCSNIVTVLIMGLMVSLGLFFNNKGFVGVLPIIASGLYTAALCKDNISIKSIRIVLLVNTVLWEIYSIAIIDYPLIMVNAIMFATTLYNVFKQADSQNYTKPIEQQ